MKPNLIDFILFGVITIFIATAWAEIYTTRDQIQTLRNENDLMVSEIEHNAKMLAAMEFKLYPSKPISGK